MKTLIHKMQNANICIYEHSSEKLRASFFKDKPIVGDIIMSHNKRGTGFLRIFEVVEIIKNRDAQVASDCDLDPTSAYFVLGINEVSNDERFAKVDNSISRLF